MFWWFNKCLFFFPNQWIIMFFFYHRDFNMLYKNLSSPPLIFIRGRLAKCGGVLLIITCWKLRNTVHNYRSFWASWWVSASQCDSGSCLPRTLHICPPVCRSRPPCRSRRAVTEGRGDSQPNQCEPMPDIYTDWDHTAGRMMPWEKSSRHLLPWLVMKRTGNATQT